MEHGEEEKEVDAPRETVLDEDRYNEVLSHFERAFKEAQPPFQGDLENETYKAILQKMRSFQP